ncbi:MAG: hypothetical protein H8Z69_06135, partial [Nanohaloarchaea archaeon]|nr:hypothetical protein [Candidatus Nanohaloarchaea archaeon]
TPSGDSSRCCPPGESYSSSAGTCLDKMTLVAVPLHYEDDSFQQFKEDTQKQIDFFAEKTPLKELENPKSRIEVKYLRPNEVENPETTECGRL